MSIIHDAQTSKAYKENWDDCVVLLNKADALNARYADLLRQIAYPRAGTDEFYADIFDVAALIQANFSLNDLEPED